MPYIANLWKFPVKGMRGQKVERIEVSTRVGVIGDRPFGIKRLPNVPDTWSKKSNFFVGANTASMVAEIPIFGEAPGQVFGLHESYLAGLQTRLGSTEKLSVLDTHGKFNLCDNETPLVSFLNLASVRSLGDYMGIELDPERFRMNVWFEGLPAFAELKWVTSFPGTRLMSKGSFPFRIHDVCERCKAPDANPETGVYDLDVFKALNELMKLHGYEGSPRHHARTVMGFFAAPLASGPLNLADRFDIE